MENEKPNPGSEEAQALGCTCPYYDNNRGEGIIINGKLCFWINGDCPIHGKNT